MPTNGNISLSQEELRKFELQWTKNMIVYWQERIDKLRVIDTGALRSSIAGILHPGPPTTIEHSFLIYGKYVSEGVSPAFRWKHWGGNIPKGGSRTPRQRMAGGKLEFLDETYRKQHKLNNEHKVGPAWGGRKAGGEPKGERDWFFHKYYSSRMVLNEMEMAGYGQAYQGMMTQAFDALFQRQRVL